MIKMTKNKSEENFYNTLWKQEGSKKIACGPSFRHKKRLILKQLKKYGLDKNSKILDIGCGEGSTLLNLNDESNKLYGMDISEEAIELSKNNLTDATYFLGDITKKETLPAQKFDLIICSEVLEHITDDDIAIENLSSLLKKGGYLIITVPHRKDYWTKADTEAGHVRRYEMTEIKNKVNKSGFKVKELFTWGYPFYNLYYNLILAKMDVNQQWEEQPKRSKLLSGLAYHIFKFDDLFIGNKKGRALVLLAKKD